MDNRLLSLLPVELRQAVEQIEGEIGSAIAIGVLPDATRRAIGNVPALAIDQGERSLTVRLLLPAGDLPPKHMIGHEIIHAKRTIIDRAPILLDRFQPPRLVVTAINNDAEHLHVIPLETEYFPEARDFWEHEFVQMLRKFGDRLECDPDRRAIRNDMLRGWLTTSVTVPNWDHANTLKALLGAVGAFSDAENLMRVYSRISTDPVAVLSTLVRFHRLPADGFQVVSVGQSPRALPMHS